jgi:formylglycine-generating enzyme required for sulfatase activity
MTMRRLLVLLLLGVSLAGVGLLACSWTLDGFSDRTAGDGGPPGEAAPDPSTVLEGGAPEGAPADAAEAGGPSCGGNPGMGASMIRVLDAGFCIDTTEVTLTQYLAFLAANPPFPPECQWKTGYTLESFGGDAAVGNVDWCDALAYCTWVGKRLCGGLNGTPLDLTNSLTVQSEWQYACTSGGYRRYPYGNTADPRICLYGDSPDSGAARAVASNPQCVGPEGVFDLSGNVWEWENACDRDASLPLENAQCNLRGGGFLRTSADWGACDLVPGGWTRSSRIDDTGIRCCSDFR